MRCNTKQFQEELNRWVVSCMGVESSTDTTQRNYRFLEEALELVQANSLSKTEAHELVDYVFNREVGELKQEVGGVFLTLCALCNANEVDLGECGEVELDRVWRKIDQIRAKDACKPKFGPLPGKYEHEK